MKVAANEERVRLALIPAILAAIALLAGLAVIGDAGWFIIIQFAVAIMAAIMLTFAFRGKQYWWLIVLAPMVIVWNPVWPLELDDLTWRIAHIVGTVAVVLAGFFITAPVEPEAKREPRKRKVS